MPGGAPSQSRETQAHVLYQRRHVEFHPTPLEAPSNVRPPPTNWRMGDPLLDRPRAVRSDRAVLGHRISQPNKANYDAPL